MAVVFILRLVLKTGQGGGMFPPLAVLAGIVFFAAILLSINISQKSGTNGSSRRRRNISSSGSVPGQQLEAKISVLEQSLATAQQNSRDFGEKARNLGERLSVTEADLSKSQGEIRSLNSEVNRLKPRSDRLKELEEWIWPTHAEEFQESASLLRTIEDSCRNPELRSLAQSLFARLHLIAATDESEPDRFAELLDRGGRDFYNWVNASGQTEGEAMGSEKGFVSITKANADKNNLQLRPARPGDMLDQLIHDPIGSGLHVIAPQSFVIRRTTDREIIRRAQVEV